MPIRFDNQRILVTGASAGIGREMARQLAEQGAKSLILVARREAELEALKREILARFPQVAVYVYPCDLSDQSAIDHLLHYISREVGAVDILINNAGLGDYTLFENASWSKTERMLRLNIEGLTYLTHRLIPPMIALGRGGVLNVSSGLGLNFMPGMTVYAATKHYVTAFSEGLRAELRGTGVVVSQVCPGPVTTEFGEVAGSQAMSGQMPSWVKLSAAQCAAESLSGFRHGKALIIPGAPLRAVLNLSRVLPRPLKRLVLGRMRGQMLRAQAADATQPVLAGSH